MTSRPELQGLIERCEKATGPDRELDAAIIVATTPTVSADDDLIYLSPTLEDDNCAHGTYWRVQRSGRSLHTAPQLTASLDASLALVEQVLPGWHWSLDSFGEATVFDSSGAFLVQADNEHYGHNKRLPLAILAALLRSLLAREDSHD